MAANYYFFTDTDLLVAQTTGAYGSIPRATVTDPDEYRVTSLHTASSNPTAYAACDAIICVQRIPATTPPLVNIVLKPLVQPALNFAPIKYILYKGILESSLINGAEVASPGNNDLTKFVWKEQAKKNISALTSAAPPAEALGIALTAAAGSDLADAEPIEHLFYRSGVAFQLPVVKGGWSLGSFDKTGFGIEVLMEGLAFRHQLLLARRLENRITVASLAVGETPAHVFDHWHEKEQVLGYLDSCAFYGSFFLAGIQAKKSTETTFTLEAGNDLYQGVLIPFANRNTAYLDIRNEYNYSFDYFKNYGSSIRISYDPAHVAPAVTDYYAGKWPILAIPATSFPGANTTRARNPFRIQLPVGDNPEPLVYVSQGYRFINSKGDGFPPELASAERFFDSFETPVGGYTATKSSSLSSMTFVVPNVTGGGATTPVSCYIRLKYLKQQQGTTTVSTVIQSANYLDNLFDPLNLPILFQGNAEVKTTIYDEEIYVNAQSVPGLNFDFIGQIGIARDPDNTSFYLIPSVMRLQSRQASVLPTLASETSNVPASYTSIIASKYDRVRVRQSALLLPTTETVPVGEFVSDVGGAASAGLASPDLSKLLMIVVTNTTFDSWAAKAVAGNLDSRYKKYLSVANLQNTTDTNGVAYTAFELILCGLALNTNTGTYARHDVNTDPVDGTLNAKAFALQGSTTSTSAASKKLKIKPLKNHYVVVLGKLGGAPSSYPILEFSIKGPPNHFVDVQVARDLPALLTGGPGLTNAWDKNQPPGVRLTQPAFSSWTNGDQTLVLNASGRAKYRMPLQWWQDLARLPSAVFGTAAIHYRFLAWPGTSVASAIRSTEDGEIAPQVLVRGNLLKLEVIDHGYSDADRKKHVDMAYTVREPNTTEMYTIVQWKRGKATMWPAGNQITVEDYGIWHISNNPDWTIDQVRTDPRYIDAVDEAKGDGYLISTDGRTATTNDSPGGTVTIPTVTHSFFALDFDVRLYLNFEVPAAVTVVKKEDDHGMDNQSPPNRIWGLVQGEIAAPVPFTIASAMWKARILQVRQSDGSMLMTNPETFSGP